MAIEIEKKYRLKKRHWEQILGRLDQVGATFKSDDFEENYLHKGGVLENQNAFLRLRKLNNLAVLTYKEKVSSNGSLKHKIEFETTIGNVAAMESIIQKLGYKLAIVYEKRRKTFHFRDVEIVLDELPFGLYMEIEGTGESIQKAERLLDIEGLKPEPRGYPSLTVKYGKLVGDVSEARFETSAAAN